MKDRGTRSIVVPGLIAVAVMVIATACGGAASTSPDVTSQPASSAPGGAVAAPSVAPSGGAAASAPAPKEAAPAAADAVLARGKEIFEKTAGGVGCAACHGMDGKGSSCIGAPANRGADEATVRKALATVSMMSIVKLTDDEIKAVVAYLAVLGKQP